MLTQLTVHTELLRFLRGNRLREFRFETCVLFFQPVVFRAEIAIRMFEIAHLFKELAILCTGGAAVSLQIFALTQKTVDFCICSGARNVF